MKESRIRKIRRRIPFLLAACVLGGVWAGMGWPCVNRSITGIPCPGCGLSRAWRAALGLDFSAAFSYHPMFWSVPILVLYCLLDGRLFRRGWLNWGLLLSIFAGIATVYCFRLYGYFNGTFSF